VGFFLLPIRGGILAAPGHRRQYDSFCLLDLDFPGFRQKKLLTALDGLIIWPCYEKENHT
jgi:hypothetical protein